MEKYCTPEFVFKKVLTLPASMMFIAMVAISWPLIILYAIKGYRYLGMGGMSLMVGVIFLIFTIMFNALSKTVTIYFDRKRMYVKYGDKDYQSYLKSDVSGLYSYNYDEQDKAFISLKIHFKNGKKITLTDANISEKKDPEKALMLKQFLASAKRQLTFVALKESRWFPLKGKGYYWYSQDPAKDDTKAQEADLG